MALKMFSSVLVLSLCTFCYGAGGGGGSSSSTGINAGCVVDVTPNQLSNSTVNWLDMDVESGQTYLVYYEGWSNDLWYTTCDDVNDCYDPIDLGVTGSYTQVRWDNHNNDLYVVYCGSDSKGNKLQFFTCNDFLCEDFQNQRTLTTTPVAYLSMQLNGDSQPLPIIAYQGTPTVNHSVAQLVLCDQEDCGSHTTRTLDNTPGTGLFSALALTDIGQPTIAYLDILGQLWLYVCSDTDCTTGNRIKLADDAVIARISLSLTSINQPVIVYSTALGGKIIVCDSLNCGAPLISSLNDPTDPFNANPPLFLDVTVQPDTNRAMVAFVENRGGSSNNTIQVVACENTCCSAVRHLQLNVSGQVTSLQISHSGSNDMHLIVTYAVDYQGVFRADIEGMFLSCAPAPSGVSVCPGTCGTSPANPTHGAYPPNCAGFVNGAECPLTCDMGYDPSHDSAICDYGTWSVETCTPSPCLTVPVAPANGTISDCHITTGEDSTCTLTCAEGYTKDQDPVCHLGVWSPTHCSITSAAAELRTIHFGLVLFCMALLFL